MENVNENVKKVSSKRKFPFDNENENISDFKIDVSHVNTTDELNTIDRNSGELHAPVKRNAEFYNMNHKKRGLALIFSQEQFDQPFIGDRRGTKEDCESLRKCLANLGFNVQIFCNCDYNEIIEVLSEAAKQDHSEHDCIVISVLSHGWKDSLYAKDIEYKVADLMHHFTPDLCPTLAGKPKIFFIRACQGDRYDPGVAFFSSETDGYTLTTSYKIPLLADFLIMYSTAKGLKAERDHEKGSWFIQALSQELEARAYESDLVTILTYVNLRIAIEYKIHMTRTEPRIPSIVSMFTRLAKFNKKF